MKKIYLFLFASLLLVSCDNSLDEMNLNPNATTNVPPHLLVTDVILKMTKSETGKNYLTDQWIMKSLANNEFAQSSMYNQIGSANIDYTGLLNAKDMIKKVEADKTIPEKLVKSYNALNLFARGYTFYHTTMQLGDVPCSNILNGLDANDFWPTYDTQESVFETIINDLDKAAALFADGAKLTSADIIYKGDVKKWEKATNGLLLKVLNQLSTKKTTVGSINVKAKFEEVAKRPLFSSYTEDFQLSFQDIEKQYYPFYKKNHNYASNTYLQETLVNMMKKYKDNRLFYYAEPAVALSASNPSDSFDAYMGLDGTAAFATIGIETKAGRGSIINLRYSEEALGEPVKRISYAEINFILAEAALRGWATPKSAEDHYNQAVTAAMKFIADYTKDKYRHGVTIDDSYITDYLKAGNQANYNEASNKLLLIMEQKYIAGFMQTQWESYYDYRRTGYPVIPINASTSMNNDAPDKLPVRFTYSGTETSNNTKNVNEACVRQFGEEVNRPNDLIWILK